MSDTLDKVCPVCGKAFSVNKKKFKAVYCSYDCRAIAVKEGDKIAAKNRGKEKSPKQCKKCGKIFMPVHHSMVYCSEECRPKKLSTAGHPPMKCVVCGKIFTPSNKRQQWCSTLCYGKIQTERNKSKNLDEITMLCSPKDRLDDLEKLAREQGVSYGQMKARAYTEKYAKVEVPEWAKK